MSANERVLCIPEAHFQEVGAFFGFRNDEPGYRERLLSPEQFSFRPRSEVETDPSFKQLIPYVVLKVGPKLFHYQRGSAGTEKRLHAKRSVGVGGHVSEADGLEQADPYRAGMLRELSEEVAIECRYDEQVLGFIYDDRTFVGSVHLGIVHLLELEREAAWPRETALAAAGFDGLAELSRQQDEFETWSQFVFEALRAG